MRKLITICAVVGLIMTVTGTAQADLDINLIFMTSCKDHLDGTPLTNPWFFEVWVEVDPGTLHHIDVTPPAGGLGSFTIYENAGYWRYDSLSSYSSLSVLQGVYPTGNYTFDFLESDSTLLNSVTLDYTGLSEPGGTVSFIYPAHGAMDVPIDPEFTWTVDSGYGDALALWLWDPVIDDDVYGDVPVSMDTLSWTPGSLEPNHDYNLEVSVFEVKDPQAGPALPTKTVGDDEFTYGLVIEYINEIEFTTVPEPATVCLLGLGALSLLRRKRKT